MAMTHAAQRARPRPKGRPNRYRQIVEILAHHGLGFIVGALTRQGRQILHTPPGGLNGHGTGPTGPEHLRLAIEELGPTFIKLGQILSTRGDLLPPAYLSELEKLQDAAPPVAEDEIRAVLLAELGRPIEGAFATFCMTPLASASIGQAHAATLLDGTEVVVKLRRPGVVEQVEEDLHILLDLALKASRHWEAARYYDLLAIAQEFAQTLRYELDYLHEGRNVERIAENYDGESEVHIPKVYWETTTSRMLTLERIYGIKITDVAALEKAGIDRSEVSHRATRLLLTMILDHGFFHADPHAGNVWVEADGRIALIDFGMVGQVEGAARDLLVQLLIAMSQKDASKLADVLLELGLARARVDRNALRRDLQRLLARYWGRALVDAKFGTMLAELLDIIRWHHLRLPPDMALLVKTLGMGEGLGVVLDPTFNLMDVYVPLAEDLARRQFIPKQWVRQLLLSGVDALQMGMELPQQLRRILGDIERGGFEITVQPASFDPYLDRLEQLVNRMIVALLAAAFTVAAALLVAALHPVGLVRIVEFFFFFVLVLSGAFGTYVVVLILRSRHSRRS